LAFEFEFSLWQHNGLRNLFAGVAAGTQHYSELKKGMNFPNTANQKSTQRREDAKTQRGKWDTDEHG